MDDRYLERRKNIEKHFIPANKIAESSKKEVSLSGNFQLEAYEYRVNLRRYTRGVVTKISNGAVIADIKRNFGNFWHIWIQHPNGDEYLLCGEDYQGYSVVNLTSEKYHVYFPEDGYKGLGFCWREVYPSPDGLTLAVKGCYWGWNDDLVFLDFRTPDTLPYPELARFESIHKYDGWSKDGAFVFENTVLYRNSDGVLFETLPKDEQDRLRSDRSYFGIRDETVRYKSPYSQ